LPHKFRTTPFRCDVEADGDGTVRVRPTGELDISTVGVLDDRLSDALSAGARTLVVDLRALEFMDSTALTLLTRWSLGAERDGYDLALVPGADRIQRLFELTGLITHFTFVAG
jgi:anti-sigma B factor antagonist